MRTAAFLVGVAVAFGACDAGETIVCDDCTGTAAKVGKWSFRGESEGNKLDLLFVMDPSPATRELRQQVVAELPAALDGVVRPGGLPWFQVGAVSTVLDPDLSCVPAKTAAKRCWLDPSYGFLATGPCGAYYEPLANDPKAVAACVADLPEVPCVGGDPLEAVAQALANSSAVGLGGPIPFLRADADHMVVLVPSTADDGSAVVAGRPVSEILHQISSTNQSTRLSALVLVPAAFDPVGSASARRLVEFTASLGSIGPVRLDKPGAFVDALGWALAQSREPMWLRGVSDLDPSVPGIQGNCTVEEFVDGIGGPLIRSLPQCGTAAPPCWRLAKFNPDAVIMLQIESPPGFCPQTRSKVEVACAV